MSTGEFFVLRASIAEERSQWLDIWRDWVGAEVFAHPAYVELFAGSEGVAMCGVSKTDRTVKIAMPFVLRAVDNGAALRDVVGPYGYGGAYRIEADVTPGDTNWFWTHYTEWAIENAVVSEFYRLHLFEEELADYPGEVLQRANNVIRDLDMSEEELWMDFEHKVRKNVNRARKLGVTVSIHEDASHQDEFLRIYEKTMDRRNASENYYFTRDFFRTINEQLAGSYAYAHAWLGGEVVSTELVLISGGRAYSFLGGTDADAFSARPNDLLKYEVMRWGRARGLTSFVLGGGATAGDGIERYKAAFAPRGLRPFHTGQRVLREEEYRLLTSQRRREIGRELATGYFPAYRADAAAPSGDSDG